MAILELISLVKYIAKKSTSVVVAMNIKVVWLRLC